MACCGLQGSQRASKGECIQSTSPARMLKRSQRGHGLPSSSEMLWRPVAATTRRLHARSKSDISSALQTLAAAQAWQRPCSTTAALELWHWLPVTFLLWFVFTHIPVLQTVVSQCCQDYVIGGSRQSHLQCFVAGRAWSGHQLKSGLKTSQPRAWCQPPRQRGTSPSAVT